MLDPATRHALDQALDDEYKARATYQVVLDRFGPVRPFVRIVQAEERHAQAEERHAQALIGQYRRHGLQPPDDRWSGQVQAPATLEEACEAGVAGEIDNQALYERLLAEVSDPQVAAIMRRLQEASAQRHLPAFRRCLARGGAGRGGPSGGPGGGPRLRHHGGPR